MSDPTIPPLSIEGGRVSVRDLAYQVLRNACVRGRLAPGQMLSEEQLASLLQVSRTPLREAIQRLQADGLLLRAGNGRISVREMRYEEAVHLYAVRSVLEQLAVEEAVDCATEADFAQLRRILAQMQQAEGTAQADVADTGRGFHEQIWKMAGNPVNERLIGNLEVHIDRYRYLSTGKTQTRRHDAVREHEAIFAAMERRDKAAAKELMRQHLEKSKQSVLRALSADAAAHSDKEG